MKAYIVNSFVHQQSGGNPAGVVLLDREELDEVSMQSIAKKLNLSETAFVKKCDINADCDYHLRFFTPTDEVPLCGHATVASFYVLSILKLLNKHELIQRTGAGLLKIRISGEAEDTRVDMMQPNPTYSALSDQQVASVIACFKNYIPLKEQTTFPIEIWNTGLNDIMLPVSTRSILNNLVVDFGALSECSKNMDVVGAHVFTIEDNQIYARNFAPLYGIDEESATGTSNGALISYLHHHLYKKSTKIEHQILQGETMKQTSAIFASSSSQGIFNELWVGGTCHLIQTIDL